MRLSDRLAATFGAVLERGRQRSTQPRVFGIPIASVPGQVTPSRDAVPTERATGCANCGRTLRPGESPADDWRVGSDGAGQLLVLCPACAERELESSG